MKFGQLLEYNVRYFFFKNYADDKGGILFPDFFCFLTKQVVSTLVSIYFGRPRLGLTIKINFIKYHTVDAEISILIV